MNSDQSFDDVMARLRAGDADAADALFQKFAGRLIALARRRLGGRMRRKVDPEDILQSVFRSFFFRQADGRLVPRNWNHLWVLLVTITTRKCSGRLDHFQAA
jgi:RNA polymerase sigma-70 factor (ECF subfamily)